MFPQWVLSDLLTYLSMFCFWACRSLILWNLVMLHCMQFCKTKAGLSAQLIHARISAEPKQQSILVFQILLLASSTTLWPFWIKSFGYLAMNIRSRKACFYHDFKLWKITVQREFKKDFTMKVRSKCKISLKSKCHLCFYRNWDYWTHCTRDQKRLVKCSLLWIFGWIAIIFCVGFNIQGLIYLFIWDAGDVGMARFITTLLALRGWQWATLNCCNLVAHWLN